MADVLLTHSYHLPYDRKQVRKMQPYPPLGTLYAAAVLRQHQISVGVFDAMLQEPEPGFREALHVHRPKIVAIYEDDFNFLTKMCLTRMREIAFQMIDQTREVRRTGDRARIGCDRSRRRVPAPGMRVRIDRGSGAHVTSSGANDSRRP